MHELTDVTGETLRRWREGKGWDVPRMARELRRAARDSGEDVAAHHGLVKMIPQWERGDRAPRERLLDAVSRPSLFRVPVARVERLTLRFTAG